MADTRYRIPITLSEDVKEDLEKMAEELEMSKNQLGALAINGLVMNYKKKGALVLGDLLKLQEKAKRSKRT